MMKARKSIGLVAHDEMKKDLLEWVTYNQETLAQHKLFATGTTGKLIVQQCPTLTLNLLKSGPLGGDQQLGSMISDGDLDVLIFFWDPLQVHAHASDILALQRIAVVYNIVLACDRATADFVLSSPLFQHPYQPVQKPYVEYLDREIPGV